MFQNTLNHSDLDRLLRIDQKNTIPGIKNFDYIIRFVSWLLSGRKHGLYVKRPSQNKNKNIQKSNHKLLMKLSSSKR